MRRTIQIAFLAILVAGTAAAQAGKVINAKCPVKPGQAANPSITAAYKGFTIGFCCQMCKNAFPGNADNIASGIPELKAAMAKASMGNKPAPKGPCECKKIIKAPYCPMCKRELEPEDVRGTECKRCETKAEMVEFCLKLTPRPFDPKKKEAPRFDEDRARVSYECETCAAKAEVEKDIKHKGDCMPKFGGGLKKICAKSGKFPHASDESK